MHETAALDGKSYSIFSWRSDCSAKFLISSDSRGIKNILSFWRVSPGSVAFKPAHMLVHYAPYQRTDGRFLLGSSEVPLVPVTQVHPECASD